jgi:hypothetical protein
MRVGRRMQCVALFVVCVLLCFKFIRTVLFTVVSALFFFVWLLGFVAQRFAAFGKSRGCGPLGSDDETERLGVTTRLRAREQRRGGARGQERGWAGARPQRESKWQQQGWSHAG